MSSKSYNSKPINLYRVIEDALAKISEPDRVRLIIPVAFPVMEVEHTVKVRSEEPLAIIEGYVLEAAARFGPIQIEEIAGLLGLNERDIECVLSNLKRFPSAVILKEGFLTTPEGTLERISDGKLVSEIDKRDAYFVNGLSGILIARKELNIYPKGLRLNVKMSGDNPKVLDSSDTEQTGISWILPSDSDGRADLVRLVTSTDISERAIVGIPEGAISVESSTGDPLRKHWILSLGILLADGSFTIRPVSRESITLLKVTKNGLNSVADMIRSGSSVGCKALNLSGNYKDIPSSWKSVAECRALDGKIILSLKDADFSNVFPHKEESFPGSLHIALHKKYFWNNWTYFVGQVQPGDSNTAQAMLKLQGIDFLSQFARSKQQEKADFSILWNEQQEQITKNWPETVNTTRVEFSVIKELALRSPYSHLVEFVSEMP